jgi:inorganic pyrophosphatase
MWESVRDLEGLPPLLTREIAHFFDVYKDLEPGKLTKVGGFDGVAAAWEEIARSYERAKTAEA